MSTATYRGRLDVGLVGLLVGKLAETEGFEPSIPL